MQNRPRYFEPGAQLIKNLAEFRALWARKGLGSNTFRAVSVELEQLSVPNECESHSLGDEEQRND